MEPALTITDKVGTFIVLILSASLRGAQTVTSTDPIHLKGKVKDVGSPINITDDNFQSEVVDAQMPVLVDFWATWCGPCRMVAPIVDELAQDYDGRVKVGKVDVDSAQKTASEFGIRSIPTLLIFKDGKVADQIVGAVPKKHLEEKLNAVLA